jgi:hypothetical protein
MKATDRRPVLLAALLLAAAPILAEPRTVDWIDLVPESARAGYDPAPPPPAHDYLSGDAGALASMQVMNFEVNEQLSGQEIRIPGFIVPLELDGEGQVIEFFLVPYFGACIHVPPPPPNQMVYVIMDKGISLDSMYAAYWISGTMKVERRSTSLGAAAYTLAGTRAEEYKF